MVVDHHSGSPVLWAVAVSSGLPQTLKTRQGGRARFMQAACGDWTGNLERTFPMVQSFPMICIPGHRIWMSSAPVRCFSCSTNAARSRVAESWRNGCRLSAMATRSDCVRPALGIEERAGLARIAGVHSGLGPMGHCRTIADGMGS